MHHVTRVRRHGGSTALGFTANRPRSRLVSALVGCTILLSISLLGCSSEHRVSPPAPPRASDVQPRPSGVVNDPSQPGDTAKSTPASVFGHAQPVSAAEWWKKYPHDAPAPVGGYKLLLNERGKGPRSFALASVARYGSLMMVITCVHQDKYRLEVVASRSPAWTWTGGNSCGGPYINSAQSPPIEPTNLPNSIKVQVSSETEYYLVLYGKP